MKIDFTPEEYYSLVEVMELANWILFSTTDGNDEKKQQYQDLEQKIFSQAEKFDMKRIIAFEEDVKEYYTTPEFESESQIGEFIEFYESNVFWEALIDQLTLRDLKNSHELEKLEKMEIKDRFNIEEPIREKYHKEFEAHGIERLTIGK